MPKPDHFGWIAPYYERWMGNRPDPRWEGRLGLPIGGRLLDAGGGTGRVARWLAARTGAAFVADASMPMALQARRVNGLNAICCLAESLPFPTGAFERVMMVDALHHVFDQKRTALELLRVLQPGGCLVIEEPNAHSWVSKILAVIEKLLLMRSHFLTPEKIRDLFQGYPVKVKIDRSGSIVWITVYKLA